MSLPIELEGFQSVEYSSQPIVDNDAAAIDSPFSTELVVLNGGAHGSQVLEHIAATVPLISKHCLIYAGFEQCNLETGLHDITTAMCCPGLVGGFDLNPSEKY